MEEEEDAWKSIEEGDTEDSHLDEILHQLKQNQEEKKQLLDHTKTLLHDSNLIRARYSVEGIRVNNLSSRCVKYGGKAIKIVLFLCTSLVFGLEDDIASKESISFLSFLLFLHILSILELSYWIPLLLPVDSYHVTNWYLGFWMLAIDSMGISALVMNCSNPLPTRTSWCCPIATCAMCPLRPSTR